jgi:hypothetical protein
VTSRLWSADTETDSDDSSASGELNLSADSMTENLTGLIQEEAEPADNDVSLVGTAGSIRDEEEEEEVLAGEELFHAGDVVDVGSPQFPYDDVITLPGTPEYELGDTQYYAAEDLQDCSTASFDSDASGSTGCAIYPEVKDASSTSAGPLPQGRSRSNSFVIVMFTALVLLLLSGLLPQLPLIVTSTPMNLQELHNGSQYHIDLSDPLAVAGIQLAEADHPVGEILVKEVVPDASPTEVQNSGEFIFVAPVVVDAASIDAPESTFVESEDPEPSQAEIVSAHQLRIPAQSKTALVTAQFGRKLRDAFDVYRRRIGAVISKLGKSVMNVLTRFRFRF